MKNRLRSSQNLSGTRRNNHKSGRGWGNSPPSFFTMEVCIECGTTYEYRSDNPKGATPSLCNSCQKKSAKFQKKLKLLLISGNGSLNCRCCDYRKSPHALTSICVKGFLSKPQPEIEAQNSFLVCLNCKARIDAKEISYSATTKPYMKVRFWETRVTIEEKEIPDHITFADSIILDVVEEIPTARRVSPKIHRLEG